ncbi:ABC transporter permease [Geomicrobium sediminis]|uniref:ABC-2 type transport system permease protein n=1 Tax=Geomicrobium sediminis TaxID=1347788 RepID=A0ABS2P8W1_9BACL|nr:ABC transporter permease [Geomicrobium sediminis]MBM7631849.1 ABC-2 type transport system permease protein [Geomicrobium sediminis]
MFKRDRFLIPIWVIGLVFFSLIVPPTFDEMFTTEQEREAIAETMSNPAMTALVGQGDMDNYTIGAMTAHQMLLLTAVVVGLMSILLMNRHIRTDEEAGRTEMLRALPVGRLATITAAFINVSLVNVLIALLVGFGLYTLNIESMGLEGSLLYGMVLGGTGIAFAGVATVCMQFFENSGGAIGSSIAMLFAFYILRAIGDVNYELLSSLSPLGWVMQSEVFTGNHWWPVLALIITGVCFMVLGGLLSARRDLGSGLLRATPGKTEASNYLLSPFGLAIRLQRTSIFFWALGLFILALSYGSVFGDLEAFFEGNDMLQQMLVGDHAQSIAEQFLPMILMVISILATVPPMMNVHRLYIEEKKNRVEHLLSRAVSRPQILLSYVTIATLNGLILLSLSAIGMWSAISIVMDDPLSLSTLYQATMVYYPAMLLMVGLSTVVIGLTPKLKIVLWLYLLYAFIVLYLGNLLDLPDWMGYLTPFGHVPKIPIEEISVLPLLVISGLSLLLFIIGFIGYRKRDIEG